MANPTLHPVPDEDVADGSPTPEGGRARVPLGRLLVAEGLLTEAQVDDALFEGGQTGERLGEIVVRRGLLSEDEIAKVLAEQWSLSYVDRASIWFDGDALARLSREDAQRLEAMPTRVQDGRVVVAVAEPTDERLAALRQVIGEDTVVVVVPRSALDAGLSSELLDKPRGAEPVARRHRLRTSLLCRRSIWCRRRSTRRRSPGRPSSSRATNRHRPSTSRSTSPSPADQARELRPAFHVEPTAPDAARLGLRRPGLVPEPRRAPRGRAREATLRDGRGAAPSPGRSSHFAAE